MCSSDLDIPHVSRCRDTVPSRLDGGFVYGGPPLGRQEKRGQAQKNQNDRQSPLHGQISSLFVDVLPLFRDPLASGELALILSYGPRLGPRRNSAICREIGRKEEDRFSCYNFSWIRL